MNRWVGTENVKWMRAPEFVKLVERAIAERGPNINVGAQTLANTGNVTIINEQASAVIGIIDIAEEKVVWFDVETDG